MSLDLSKLEKVNQEGHKIVAQCPACFEKGEDKTGNHLVIYGDGAYGCVKYQDDDLHSKRIFELAGVKTEHQNGALPQPVPHRPQNPVSDKSTPRREVTAYPYTDESGTVIYEAVRYEPKDFRQRRTVHGKQVWDLKGIGRLPYRLPEVIKSPVVWIVEGEKDADNLRNLGFCATCRAGGASTWEQELTPWFANKDVILCGDNDEPGRAFMEKVEAGLQGVAKSIRRVTVPEPNKDVSDFLAGLGDETPEVAIERLLSTADPVQTPICQDWIDFDAEQGALPDAPEIVAGMIRRGEKASIGGSSKSKKTFTGLDIGLSVASGTPWMGLQTTKVPVVIVDMELRKKTLQLRIRAILKARGITLRRGDLHVIPLRGRVTTARKTLAYVKANCPKNAGFFLIDPFYKLAAGKDENAAGDITSIMNLIDDLGREFDAAILYSAHYSKGNQASKESIDRISGSGVFGRDADTIISMTAHEEPDCFTIDPIFRSFAPMTPWVVRWNYPLMERADELDPTKLKKGPGMFEAKFSLDQLTSVIGNQTLTSSEIERECRKKYEMSDSTVKRLMKKALKEGKIERLKVGLWKGVTA